MNAHLIPTRPALRYHGGKWVLAPWIIQHFPKHRVYVEAFGGAASVLLRKPRVYAEVYNDLDDELVNLFTVLRDPVASEKLRALLELTPFARVDNRAVTVGFRATGYRNGTTPAHDWANFPAAVPALAARFRGVTIEHRDAFDLIGQQDREDALFYIDPPYLPETRSTKSRKSGARYHGYVHELTVEDHRRLLELLLTLKGMAVVSGYPATLYDEILCGGGGGTG